MGTVVFVLGSHPALSVAELRAYGERVGLDVSWDLSRLPVALMGTGLLPSPQEVLPALGGTTMIGTLRATFAALPSAEEILGTVPEILEPRQGKRLVGVSALPSSHGELAADIRALAMKLKRAIGMKGTRVVFPPAPRPVPRSPALRGEVGSSRGSGVGPARRSDLSTAQLLHNKLPRGGTAIVFLATPNHVDLVVVEAIQDIEAYARRDRGRPHADPGTGMLPPKVAQILLNLSLVPPGGTVYDPFCGVGTIPMEALLMGLKVIASDRSPAQVQRTTENLRWLATGGYLTRTMRTPTSRKGTIMNDSAFAGSSFAPRVFTHDVARGAIPLPERSVDTIVTEGWLGPARTTSPPPREAEETFGLVSDLLAYLLSSVKAVLKSGGTVLVAVPAFRVGKRVLRFPIEDIPAAGFTRDPLVPNEWRHLLFREASSGTLLYGRPDAHVLREVVRYRKA